MEKLIDVLKATKTQTRSKVLSRNNVLVTIMILIAFRVYKRDTSKGVESSYGKGKTVNKAHVNFKHQVLGHNFN